MHASRWDSPLWSMGILLPLFISAPCVSHGRRWNTGLPDHVALRCRTYLKSDNIYYDIVCLRTEAFFLCIDHPVLYRGRTQSLKLELHFWFINFGSNSKVDPVAGIWVQLFQFICQILATEWIPLYFECLCDWWKQTFPVISYFCYRCFFVLLRGPQLSRVSQQMHRLSSHLCRWHTDVVFMRAASDFEVDRSLLQNVLINLLTKHFLKCDWKVELTSWIHNDEQWSLSGAKRMLVGVLRPVNTFSSCPWLPPSVKGGGTVFSLEFWAAHTETPLRSINSL